MLRPLLARNPSTFQVTPLLISLLSASSTLWLTLSFCWQVWPLQKRPLAVLIGVVWEVGKLALMARGLDRVRTGATFAWRLGGALLICVSLAASAGSVLAAVGFMQAQRALDQQETLTSSTRHQSLRTEVNGLDQRIAVLTNRAASEAKQNLLTRSQHTLDAAATLSKERAAVSGQLNALEINPTRYDEELALRLHLFVSVMLELFAFGALYMWHDALARKRQKHAGAWHPEDAAIAKLAAERAETHLAAADIAELDSRHADTRHTNASAAARGLKTAASRSNIPNSQQSSLARKTPGAPYTLRRGKLRDASRHATPLQSLEDSRRFRACRDFANELVEHCLQTGRNDGLLATDEVRYKLCRGKDWRTLRGYLCLLQDAGAVSMPTKDCINVMPLLKSTPHEPSMQESTLRTASSHRTETSRVDYQTMPVLRYAEAK